MNMKLDPSFLDAGDLMLLANLLKPWTVICALENWLLPLEFPTYAVINRTEFCEFSFAVESYYLAQTMLSCQDNATATDGLFSM